MRERDDLIEHVGCMSDAACRLLQEWSIPTVKAFAILVQQSMSEVGCKYRIPESKTAERQKAVADPASRPVGSRLPRRSSIEFGTDAGSSAVGHDVFVVQSDPVGSLDAIEAVQSTYVGVELC